MLINRVVDFIPFDRKRGDGQVWLEIRANNFHISTVKLNVLNAIYWNIGRFGAGGGGQRALALVSGL